MPIVDISSFNHITNMSAMLADMDGVIMRIGFRGYGKAGNIAIDAKFKSYIDKVIASGKPWGIYFIDQAVTPAEGTAQADWIHKTIKGYDMKNMHLGVWCDSEYSAAPSHQGRGDLIPRTLRTQCVIAMLDRLTQLGYKNGIYASNSWLNSHLVYDQIKNRWIWNAAYGINDGVQHALPGYRHDLHQYTSRAKVTWDSDRVDLSVICNKDFYNPITAPAKGSGYVYGGVDYTPIFDPVFYANMYPDLKKAFGSYADHLFKHFTTYGMKEGRQPSKNFVPQLYRARYPDLNKAFCDNLTEYYKHYILFGEKEGRSAI